MKELLTHNTVDPSHKHNVAQNKPDMKIICCMMLFLESLQTSKINLLFLWEGET